MYDKQYFKNELMDMLNPIAIFYDGGNVRFAKHSAWYENASADMEAFARPLWGLVPFWAGGGSDSRFEKLYIDGLIDGADRNSKGFWGDCHDRDQRFVEMASIAYGLIFAPDKIWEPLSDSEKDRLEKWLVSINDKEVCDSNWIFFRILVNTAMKKIGRAYSAEVMEKDFARIDEFYLGGGWYKDGIHGQTDYYIPFAFHFYGLVYAIAMGGEDKERADKFKKTRLRVRKNLYLLVRRGRRGAALRTLANIPIRADRVLERVRGGGYKTVSVGGYKGNNRPQY